MDGTPHATTPDSERPSPGRIYDWFLNGNDHTAADEKAARMLHEKIPELYYMAQANRVFLQRAAGVIARAGIRQFIDLGSGIPTAWNTHEIVQVVDPDARVVYVDNDPVVIEMSREMLRRRGEKNVAYIDGDIQDPDAILNHPDVRRNIDFSKPVGHMHIAIWHFVPDQLDPWALLRRYLDSSPSGSHLALTHITADGQREEKVKRFYEVYANATAQLRMRTVRSIDRFFDGLEYLPPCEGAEAGLSFVDIWGSKNPSEADPSHTWIPCGVAVKP
ncbi:SAM-dependent methyltransferase [Actinomadura adrarensis]|uniref:SAM-dependent methyltransferase n=1 Tax=Actinomadura adrarensis TaxID=1819600 RepID=A0ABW3CQ89_9ACTN